MTAALLFALGVVGTRSPLHRVAGAALLVLLVVSYPIVAAPIVMSGLGYLVRRRLRMRILAQRSKREDTARLAELTVIGLTGGLGLQPALDLAASTLGGETGAETKAMLRRMRVEGAAACAGVSGAAVDLYRTIAQAMESGASIVDQVRRIADQLHADLAASRLQALRRLPVLMLFPLTLLILPGFLLLTVAPALVDAFGRLDF